MAHAVEQVINEIKALDKKKIVRFNLGDASFKEFEPIYDQIISRGEFVAKYHSLIDDNTNNQSHSVFTNLKNQLSQLVGFDKSQFVAQQQQVKKQVTTQLNAFKQYWPQYAIAAIEDSGLLTNIDVKGKFGALTQELKESTETALKKIEEESKQIVDQAKAKADEIESSVRKTAAKISVQEAQQQFSDAASHNMTQIKIWGRVSIGLVLIFTSFVIYLLEGVELPDEWDWTVLYNTVIRISILGIVGTLLSFSIKMLKANYHMHAHNLHRKRIANSMASFAESAMNKDQRDFILSQLVESISNFGNSGLLSKEGDGANISIDSITKTVSNLKEN